MLFPLARQANGSPRVVVTGAGIITSLGAGWNVNAEGFREGRKAFGPVTLFDVSRQRVKMAAEVDLPAELPPTQLPPRSLKRMDRAARLLLHAGHEAWTQSGWEPADHLPLVLGTTGGGMSMGEAFYRQTIRPPHSRCGQPSRVVEYQPQRQALDLLQAFGFSGPITIIANACASGANAIGHAFELLRRGQAERVLAGGYEGLSQLIFSGFDSLQALSPTQCRPFDAQRDGLTLGEGAAVIAVETLDSASSRNAEILAEIVGYGAATDTHHLTQPHPQGDAAFAAMTAACESAGISADQIGYVNAHGTGTPLNDSAEAAALNRWAGSRARHLPVSSTKSSIGHLLGAAGAVEVVICLMALKGRWLPPTSSLRTPDPACCFSVLRQPMDLKVEYVLTNSFGFGGANASLILRRWS
ncbi:MAG TPA: beta-ketoacyl-[acyl-carrier-protein] synthase family protein [Patescibacteria group bacterium]|nr:beta-ketoacyl-[acyl-carrier-protein] synthase family protein [Patescibacteria group bacterium]